jgi:exopolysaccharide production protein ExoQ
MKVYFNHVVKFYLAIAVFYYIGFFTFGAKIFGLEGTTEDLYSANASGSLIRQISGLLLLLLGAGLVSKVQPQVLLRTAQKSALWLILVLYFICSIYWSYEPAITLRRVIAFSTVLLAAFCVVHIFEINTLLNFIAKSIFWAALFGLAYALVDPKNGLTTQAGRLNSLVGIFGDKNAGARVYAYGILLFCGLGKYKKIEDLIRLVVLGFCIVWAQSATAVVLTSMGLALMVLFAYFRTTSVRTNLNRVFVICVLLLLLSVAINYLYDFLLTLLGRDPSLTNRVIIWSLIDEYLAKEPWFGYGFGAFWSSEVVLSFVDRWGYIGNAHSGYYEVMLHGGRLAILLLLMAMGKTLLDAVSCYIKSRNSLLISMMISIVLVQAIVNYVAFIIINHNSFDMFLFGIIVFAIVRESNQPFQSINQRI